MNFERKPIPFLHKGMNWNAPVEKIPEGEIAWGKNVRVLEQGSVSSAHGHTQVYAFGGVSYIHTISRLNVLNPAFDPAVARTYVFGADQSLYVFQDQSSLGNSSLNPVTTPAAFSGNPLSVVDAQPAGAAVAWKYIADSQQMVTAGYYPADHAGSNMAHALTMGMTPPVNTELPRVISGGNLLGAYQWIFAYRRTQTGARSNPSAATRQSISAPATTLTDGSGNSQPFYSTFVLPTAPIDPMTGSPDLNVWVDVYRFGGTINRWALVGSGPAGSSFTDNTADQNLLAAPSPPQTTDPSTGLSRFNLFRPFVTPDIARSGAGSVSQAANGVFLLTASSGAFNVNWLPGSSIYLDGTACTIYQVQSPTVVELADNLTGMGATGSHNWSTNAGTLTAGQPLSHLWGPYGVGQSGSYLFACGDPNSPGSLYWTNGNDPDSTDIVNNIEVTSPSEKLMTGCVYDGQPYCWSTERQFQVFPSLTVFGQFTTQELAGAKGCWLEWSLSVQSNGFADQSVSWRGKDGIYDWSTSGGLQRLSDPLYAFFPHDNNPGLAPETIMPFIGANSSLTETVGNIDDTQPKYHRTCWFQGLLFYDFVAQSSQGNTYSCLVWDSVNIPGGGWVSLDQPFDSTTLPVARGIEIGANDPNHDAAPEPGPGGPGPMARGGNLKVTNGLVVYDYFGYTRGFESRLVTRAEDMGDSRAMKLWGDYWVDCTPLSAFTLVPLVSWHTSALTSQVVPPSGTGGTREQFTVDFVEFENAGGAGLLNNTLGLDIRWVASNGQFAPSLYQWTPSYVVKPEVIVFRASDPDDAGATQAKYLMGMNVEANTFNYSIPVNVLVDGVLVTTLNLNHNGQSEHPYAWNPVAGYEFQVQLQNGTSHDWQLYKISWIFEVWPDAVARDYPFQNLGTSRVKYIRQIVLPIETGNVAGTVTVLGDDGALPRSYTNLQTLNLVKTAVPLVLNPPMVAHEIQISTGTSMRAWVEEIQVDFEVWPELSLERSAFTDCGYKGAKYMEGANIALDTNGAAVSFEIHWENGNKVTLGPVTTPADQKTLMPFSFGSCGTAGPFAAEELQIVPLGPVRIWYEEINWVFQPWPEAIAITYPFQDLGTAGAKYIRNIVLPMETGGATGQVALLADDGQGLRYFSNLLTPNLQKSGIDLTPTSPVIAHEIQFQTCTPMRIWPAEVKVDFEPWPELTSEVSPFTNCGYAGAKFMQGCIIPMDTNGQPVQFKIVADCGQSVTLPATTTTGGCKTEVAFSFSPCNNPASNPFIAHEVQVVPLGAARSWFDEIQWIFEPAPELAYTWDTQPTDHDMPGWHFLRDCYIAYQGGNGAPTLTITTEYGSISYALDTVAPDQYVRCYRPLQPQKAKWRSYRVEGCGAFRLYKKDCAVNVKAWGSTGPFISAAPFGGPSRVDGARI